MNFNSLDDSVAANISISVPSFGDYIIGGIQQLVDSVCMCREIPLERRDLLQNCDHALQQLKRRIAVLNPADLLPATTADVSVVSSDSIFGFNLLAVVTTPSPDSISVKGRAASTETVPLTFICSGVVRALDTVR